MYIRVVLKSMIVVIGGTLQMLMFTIKLIKKTNIRPTGIAGT